jgi:hypothetical protein
MPNITYSLGEVSFNAVPETLTDTGSLPVRSEATLGRAVVHTIGVTGETIVLSGKYMTPDVKASIDAVFDACRETGNPVVFNDGVEERDVLIRSFETTPIVGKTEGYGFRIELAVV